MAAYLLSAEQPPAFVDTQKPGRTVPLPILCPGTHHTVSRPFSVEPIAQGAATPMLASDHEELSM
jgi:hypothetical protein